jgi:N-acetylneuraminic acid mutarotase
MVGPLLDGTWTPISAAGAPSGAGSRLAVWSGTELVVWGGAGGCLPLGLCATGARYDPARDAWTAMSTTGAPTARDEQAATWTSQAVLVWGGRGCNGLTSTCGDGALYNPANDGWTAISSAGAPAARGWAVGAWTGKEAFVWGGEDPAANQVVQTGGLYDPIAGSWRTVPVTGAPGARRYHSVLWSGSTLLVWGGSGGAQSDVALGDGAAYDPGVNTWRPIAAAGAPAPRWSHSAVWTGSEMVVWGGLGCGVDSTGAPATCGDGGRYDPATDRWRPLSSAGAPSARVGHTAVWTGRLMIVWGGMATRCADGSSGACNDGAAYDPAADQWRPLAVSSVAAARAGHVAAWTGSSMVVWGGTGAGAAEASLMNGVTFTPATP